MPNKTKTVGVSEAKCLNNFVTLDFFGLAYTWFLGTGIIWEDLWPQTKVAGLLEAGPPLAWEVGALIVCFCSYQASISVEKASAKLSLLLCLLPGFNLARAGMAVTVPEGERTAGLAGSSGGTERQDSREVDDLWLADPDLGDCEPGNCGESESAVKLLALVFLNLVEYL